MVYNDMMDIKIMYDNHLYIFYIYIFNYNLLYYHLFIEYNEKIDNLFHIIVIFSLIIHM